MLIGVNYHYVREHFSAPYPAIRGITPSAFERQLDLLSAEGQFVTASAVEDAVLGRDPLPERAILITLDDGLAEQYELAWPILQRKGIPALFFVSSGPLVGTGLAMVHRLHILRSRYPTAQLRERAEDLAPDLGIDFPRVDPEVAATKYRYDDRETAELKYLLNILLGPREQEALVGGLYASLVDDGSGGVGSGLYMRPDQVRTLSQAGCVGSHCHLHRSLGLLTAEEASEELRVSRQILEELGGAPVQAVCYPFGSPEACPPRVGKFAAKVGYHWGVTIEQAGNRDVMNRMFLARLDTNDVVGGKACRWKPGKMFQHAPTAAMNRRG